MAISVYFGGKLIKQLGAYVKTDLSAIRQINGTATGIPAFLGLAEGGEPYKVYRLMSYAEAVEVFKGGPLLDHIKAAFIGGAGEVVAIRIGTPTVASATIEINTDSDPNNNQPQNLVFKSYEASKLSNSIYISFDLDTNFTPGNQDDDLLVVNIYQRNPDQSVTRETFVFPRKFTEPQVLVKRQNSLFFVDRSVINAALATGPAWTTTLVTLLKDTLFPTDVVQIFNASQTTPVDVPLGLVLYEILRGGLFGFTKSRLVKVEFANISDLFSNTYLFNPNAQPFYDDGTGTYRDFAYLSSPANWFAKNNFTVDLLIDPVINSHVLGNRIFTLSGGSNGDDGTGYYQAPVTNYIFFWTDGLRLLEEEEVNFVQPAYRFNRNTPLVQRINYFKNISSVFLAHITTMSQVNRRRVRVGVFGFPAPSPAEVSGVTSNDYLYDQINGALNVVASMFGSSDRTQVVVHPFRSSVLNDAGVEEVLGGEFFASYVVGLHCNREPQESITFLPASGLGTPIYDWTYKQKDDLISQRILFVEKVKNSFGAIVYRIHHNPTSWTGPVTQGIQEMVVRRIDDFVSMFVYKNLEEQFIGRQSRGRQTAVEIKNYTELLLNRLLGKQIVAYKDVKVEPNEDRTVYFVEFFYQPVTEIKFILVTMKMSFELT